jgi:hypothetical protein
MGGRAESKEERVRRVLEALREKPSKREVLQRELQRLGASEGDSRRLSTQASILSTEKLREEAARLGLILTYEKAEAALGMGASEYKGRSSELEALKKGWAEEHRRVWGDPRDAPQYDKTLKQAEDVIGRWTWGVFTTDQTRSVLEELSKRNGHAVRHALVSKGLGSMAELSSTLTDEKQTEIIEGSVNSDAACQPRVEAHTLEPGPSGQRRRAGATDCCIGRGREARRGGSATEARSDLERRPRRAYARRAVPELCGG